MNTRKLALLTILTGLCIALQLAPRPPNVEFTSFFSFILGLTEGTIAGMFFGSFVMAINGFLSPVGFGGLNIPFQIVGMMFAGAMGGLYSRFTHNMTFSKDRFLETAVLGACIALVYDVITNFGFGLQLILAGENPALAFSTALVYGSFYSLIHIVSNTAVFGVLFLPVVNAYRSMRIGESPWSKKEPLHS